MIDEKTSELLLKKLALIKTYHDLMDQEITRIEILLQSKNEKPVNNGLVAKVIAEREARLARKKSEAKQKNLS